MSEFEYIMATDFDRAWLNFELDLPLKPGPNGEPNRFYVNRPGNPIAELIDALHGALLSSSQVLLLRASWLRKIDRIAALDGQPGIQKKYWPINFCIREEADIIDMDFRDILLAIGSRMFRDYRKAGGRLPEQLLKELEWVARQGGRRSKNDPVRAGCLMKLGPAWMHSSRTPV